MTKINKEVKVEKENQQITSNNLKKFKVISTANHPITLKYGNEEIILSPKQKIELLDRSKLKVLNQDTKYIRII